MTTNLFWQDYDYKMPDCPCCGAGVTAQPSWLSRYRALYLTETGTKLSDINTSEHDWEDFLFTGGTSITKAQILGPWFLMSGIKPIKVALFHELCWSRLVQNLKDENLNIELDKIFEVCQNIGRCLDSACYQFENPEFDIHNSEPSIPRPEYVADAPSIPNKAFACVQQILRYPLRIPKLLHQLERFATGQPLLVDCFAALPTEINLQISIHLDTASFFNLRYVSRAMANVFNIQSFWKSRFQLSQDRGYLSCLQSKAGIERTDWRLMFRRTANIDVFLGYEKDSADYEEYLRTLMIFHHLHIMKELWMQAQWLKERYTMTKAPDRQISLYRDLLNPDLEPHCKKFDAGFQCDREPWKWQNQDSESYKVCLANHVPLVQTAPLDDSTIGLAVSILRERMTTVITGFELLGDSKTPNLTFGYRIPGRQVIVDLRGKSLTGFTIFSSKGNIHALYPVFSEKHVHSSWIGQPTTCNGPGNEFLDMSIWTVPTKICRGSLNPLRPCNSRDCARNTKITDLILDRGVTMLGGKFDYYKMIGLSIA